MNLSSITTESPSSLGNSTSLASSTGFGVSEISSTAATTTSTTTTRVPFVPDTFIVSAVHENHSHVGGSNSISNEPLSFILIPLLVILGVAFFSGVTIYCIQRRKRSLDNLRHTLIPLYTFTRADDNDDWGVLLDDQNGRGVRNQRRSHR